MMFIVVKDTDVILFFRSLKFKLFSRYCRVYFITDVCYKIYYLEHFLFTTIRNVSFILYLSIINSNEIDLIAFIVFNL